MDQIGQKLYAMGKNGDITGANALISTIDPLMHQSCANQNIHNTSIDVQMPTKIKNVTNANLGEKYSKLVESGNVYPNELLSIESNYFLSKYGSAIYNNLLKQRNSYLVEPKPFPSDFDLSYNMIIQNLNTLTQNNNANNGTIDILNTYLPSFDSNTIYKEIEYRDIEYIRLYQINYVINIIYYIGFTLLLLLLFSSNNLLFKERFLLYLCLAILPFLYPWIFLISRKLWNYMSPSIIYNGPKNAFIDTNKVVTTEFSNNNTNNFKDNINTTTL